MKQIFIATLFILANISHLNAQIIRELVIEPDPEPKPSNSVFVESCGSPDLGAIVFSSAISGLWFEMDPQSKLKNMRYNRQRNEYVMCVEPTEGTYRFLISHADFKAVDFFVENVKKSSVAPQFFKINPKDVTSQIVINNNGDSSSKDKEKQMPANVSIETPRRMEVKLTNLELIDGIEIRSGYSTGREKQLKIDFLLTNRGQDINNYYLGPQRSSSNSGYYSPYNTNNNSSSAPTSYDDFGTTLNVKIISGSGNTNSGYFSSGGWNDIYLPGNTPVLVSLLITGFNPKATHLTLIRFFGSCSSCEGAEGAFTFKNIPLQSFTSR